MRTALLAAVSHDLRTPLASAKAAVTSLRSPDIRWTMRTSDELLATADESLDRLAHLVGQPARHEQAPGRALAVFPRPAGLERSRRGHSTTWAPAAGGRGGDPGRLPEVRVRPAIWSGSSST
jgi:two-component system sensor histidine kinase KdpD